MRKNKEGKIVRKEKWMNVYELQINQAVFL